MAGAGGKRPGAGRKPKPKVTLEANKRLAVQVLALTQRPIHVADCRCQLCRWWGYLTAQDLRLRFDADKYLEDRANGKPVQTVNHIHDKPIEIHATVSLAEAVQKARKRASEA